MKSIEKIERRVRGLLAQAADREGTPEGEAFQARAFELMARYGVEETQLADDSGDEMVKRTIDLSGSYTPVQFTLAGEVGRALHCYVLGNGTGRRVSRVTVYGKARHVERFEMLFTILNPQMIAGADKSPHHAGTHRSVQKRSWMHGFILGVRNRLKAAEAKAAEDTGQAVALLDDYRAAEQFARHQVGRVREIGSKGSTDLRAMAAGREAGEGTDIGQDRVGGRIAITA